MKSRFRALIVILIVLNIAALLYSRSTRRRAAIQKQQTVDLNSIADTVVKNGAMNRDEYFHLQEIDQRALSNGRLSDEDVDWCLTLMSLRGNADTALGTYVRGHVEQALRRQVAYTKSQKDKLFHQVVEPAFALRDASAEYDRISVAKLVRVTKDKRAVPYLLPMLNDKSNGAAAKFARETLDSLGYSH